MTVSGVRVMRDNIPRGEGERRESARRRKRGLIIGALFTAGAITGFYMGHTDGGALFDGRPGGWPPAVAAALAALYLTAIIGGSLLLNGVMDEVERQRSYKAVSFAGAVLILVYPTWFALWKGGFVGEPIHWVLFVLFWLSLALSSLFYRFR
jgi:hypothetical protein